MSRRSRGRRLRPPKQAPITKAVDAAIYKSEESLEGLILTPEDEARLKKLEEREPDAMRKWAFKTTTRKDVIQILELYQQRKLMPMAYRLDLVEAFVTKMSLPFYKRWYIDFRVMLRNIKRFVQAKLDRSSEE